MVAGSARASVATASVAAGQQGTNHGSTAPGGTLGSAAPTQQRRHCAHRCPTSLASSAFRPPSPGVPSPPYTPPHPPHLAPRDQLQHEQAVSKDVHAAGVLVGRVALRHHACKCKRETHGMGQCVQARSASPSRPGGKGQRHLLSRADCCIGAAWGQEKSEQQPVKCQAAAHLARSGAAPALPGPGPQF